MALGVPYCGTFNLENVRKGKDMSKLTNRSRFKMESIRKLSNQWTKILYQNNLKYIAFFFILFIFYLEL